MITIGNFFVYDNGHVLNKELGKLVSYSYDLHERDFSHYCNIPTFKFVYLNSVIYNGMKIEDGGIYGWRIYRDHSSDMIITQIGVFKREKDGNLKSYFLQTDNQDYDVSSCKTKLIEDGRYFDYDTNNGYSRNIKPDEFVDAIVMLGFHRDDVIAVAEGKMTAKEAFRKVAPNDIKNIEWLNIGRRKYVFDGNVAISGDFSGINIDKFPFPFKGQPIFDCSKVNTWCMKFGDNKRSAKLININSNKDSIKYTDIRAAIIDEPIDLSLVDAYNTIFGHQVVLYPECSIAPLNKINLALAIDEHGKKYITDIDGHIFNEWFPETEEVIINQNSKQIKIFANADNEETTRIALENGAEGIGLVRTENVFNDCSIDDLETFMYYYDFEDKESLDVLRRLASNQLEKILFMANGKRVIIRLLDFKFSDFLRLTHMSLDDLDLVEMPDTRGAKGLYRGILTTQLDVLMELASKLNIELNILIPLIDDYRDLEYIRDAIIKKSQKYNISRIRIGAMIENLHSVNYADEIAKMVDFIAIGTNDLTESVTGLSRDSQEIDFQILSDKVKNFITEIIYRVKAVRPEIEIGICGEHTNYIDNMEFLSNLNIDYVTCAPPYIKLNHKLLNNSQSKAKVLQKKIQ